MNGRIYWWLAVGTLVLTLGGPLTASAQTVGQGHAGQKDNSVGVRGSKQSAGEQVLLAAVSAAPTAAANGPAAQEAPPAMA